MGKITDKQKVKLWLSWVNDFITVAAFQEYYGFASRDKALEVIKEGKALAEQEDKASELKEKGVK